MLDDISQLNNRLCERGKTCLTLTIDPAVRSGEPFITGTDTFARDVARRVWTGDDFDIICADHRITRGEVLLCCWWLVEDGFIAVRDTPSSDRDDHWTAWAHHHRDRLSDPSNPAPDDWNQP